jgi:hypothetical protein
MSHSLLKLEIFHSSAHVKRGDSCSHSGRESVQALNLNYRLDHNDRLDNQSI